MRDESRDGRNHHDRHAGVQQQVLPPKDKLVTHAFVT
jgi:hypothetical protein